MKRALEVLADLVPAVAVLVLVAWLVVLGWGCVSPRPMPDPPAGWPAPSVETGERYALLEHDFDGDGIKDVLAVKCILGQLDPSSSCLGKPWNCAVVIVKGGPEPVGGRPSLLERTWCWWAPPESVAVDPASGETIFLILGKWHRLSDDMEGVKVK